ncbi:MAG: PEP-CTERM sorting domain-containing protein [Sideroxyarcus sp.]|nr:PEP-CTERM sorting domain-containing protein [Sideroxyarcus sp.]
MKFKALIISACMFFCASIVQAAPVVTFTTSGSAGSWLVDFSVTNTLGGTNNIYFFGVQAPTTNIVSSPTGWTSYQTFSNISAFGGSSATYNDVWLIPTSSSAVITPGDTVGGFNVIYNTVDAPTSVSWFAFSYGDTYTGSDHFYNDKNPGFQGVATVEQTVTAVPEPETYAMLMVGLGLLGFSARRKKNTAV